MFPFIHFFCLIFVGMVKMVSGISRKNFSGKTLFPPTHSCDLIFFTAIFVCMTHRRFLRLRIRRISSKNKRLIFLGSWLTSNTFIFSSACVRCLHQITRNQERLLLLYSVLKNIILYIGVILVWNTCSAMISAISSYYCHLELLWNSSLSIKVPSHFRPN